MAENDASKELMLMPAPVAALAAAEAGADATVVGRTSVGAVVAGAVVADVLLHADATIEITAIAAKILVGFLIKSLLLQPLGCGASKGQIRLNAAILAEQPRYGQRAVPVDFTSL
jgi:hypothetical protein